MTAPKAKTLQARFGFSDPELTTPKHDAIMLWLDANIDQVLTDALGEEVETHIGDGITYSMIGYKLESLLHDAVKIEKEMYAIDSLPIDEEPRIWDMKMEFQKLEENLQRHYENRLPNQVESPKTEIDIARASHFDWRLEEARKDIQKKRQEKIDAAKARLSRIEKGRQRLFSYRACEIVLPTPDEWMVRCTSKIWEKPIVSETAKTSYTIGFVDMMVKYAKPRYFMHYDEESQSADFSVVQSGACGTVYFEVKPSIPSLGEVIRQIRMYQTYTGADPWFIVSPDDRFAEQLRGQGIGFVKVPNTL